MKDWLQKNYWILVLLTVLGVAAYAYDSEREADHQIRKGAKPDVSTWVSDDSMTTCYILDYGRDYQQMECIRETYRD